MGINVTNITAALANTNIPFGAPAGIIVRDSVTGDFLYPLLSTSAVNLWTNTDGASQPSKLASSNITASDGPFCMVQDTVNDRIHMCSYYGGAMAYYRLALTRSGGHVTGWTVEANGIAFPAVPSSLSDARVWQVVIMPDGNGTRQLVFVGTDGSDTGNWRYTICTAALTVSATSGFKSLAGTANTWSVGTTHTDGTFASYGYHAQVQPIGSAGNLVVLWGAQGLGDQTSYVAPVRAQIWTASGATWSAGGESTVVTGSTQSFLGTSCSLNGNAYFATSYNAALPGVGSLYITKVDSSGTITQSITGALSFGTSIDGWEPMMGLHVTTDEKVILICCPRQYSAMTVRCCSWDGASWTSQSLVGGTTAKLALWTSGRSWGDTGIAIAVGNNTGSPPYSAYFASAWWTADATYVWTDSAKTLTLTTGSTNWVWSGAAPSISGNTAGNASGSTDVTTLSVNIGSPTNGERVVLCLVKRGTAAFTATPDGWTAVDSLRANGTTDSTCCYYRDCDGTEGATVSFTVASAISFAAKTWRIAAGTFDRYSPPAIAVHQVTSAASNNNPSAVTPGWGSGNDLFLCWVGCNGNATITGSPTNYSTIGSVRSTTSTSANRQACGYCYRTALTTTEDPSAFTNSSCISTAYTIAIAPLNIGVASSATCAQVSSGVATESATGTSAGNATSGDCSEVGGTAATESATGSQVGTADCSETATSAATEAATATQTQSTDCSEQSTGVAAESSTATQSLSASCSETASAAATESATATQTGTADCADTSSAAATEAATGTQSQSADCSEIASAAAIEAATANNPIATTAVCAQSSSAAATEASTLTQAPQAASCAETASTAATQAAIASQTLTAQCIQQSVGIATEAAIGDNAGTFATTAACSEQGSANSTESAAATQQNQGTCSQSSSAAAAESGTATQSAIAQCSEVAATAATESASGTNPVATTAACMQQSSGITIESCTGIGYNAASCAQSSSAIATESATSTQSVTADCDQDSSGGATELSTAVNVGTYATVAYCSQQGAPNSVESSSGSQSAFANCDAQSSANATEHGQALQSISAQCIEQAVEMATEFATALSNLAATASCDERARDLATELASAWQMTFADCSEESSAFATESGIWLNALPMMTDVLFSLQATAQMQLSLDAFGKLRMSLTARQA